MDCVMVPPNGVLDGEYSGAMAMTNESISGRQALADWRNVHARLILRHTFRAARNRGERTCQKEWK
jgi:hypothetical protein